MNTISKIILQLDSYISGHPIFIITLIGTGLFFTIYLKFPQIRYFKRAFKILLGHHDKQKSVGDASHFQALSTALSGTVGTGNIAGVALAIHIGGPSALLWMLFTAAIGMATKFVEVTLSHKYRKKLDDGTIAGGPMFFMSRRLNINIKGKTIHTGKIIAIIFSIFTIVASFGTGCLPQTNSISTAMNSSFGIPNIWVGGILALVLASVILGGIKRIVKVTEKLVPIMGGIYIISVLVVVIFHIDNLLPGLAQMFSDALSGTAATGGFLGASVSYAMSNGVNRGLFSNEAGQGSAPIAHAAARCEEPASEGLVALLEPFIDTIIICMLTGTMIISSGVWSQKYENNFQQADIKILNTNFQSTDSIKLALNNPEKYFNGKLEIKEGIIVNQDITFIHAHSVAEEIKVFQNENLYSGIIEVNNGIVSINDLNIKGKSLIHSVPLTIKAFSSSWFGEFGEYLVALSLLLFAFSTSIAWSYYGDRACSFLFGTKAIIPFRIIYVIGFFIGSFTDTTIVWSIASIGIVCMSMPNLIGILLLRKEMKREIDRYDKQLTNEN
ncbi:MAG: sodium:alanine symporter family protein [Bacteroidales bacterium]|nr:sodium:alanine symporter family protein [Bacteroidales bacterium]